MSNCLICHQNIIANTSWSSFLLLNRQEDPVCPTCTEQLEKITGETCNTCGRPLVDLPPDFHQHHLCQDCQQWENHPHLRGVLKHNRSIYVYNDFMKETLARYKFRGDYQLVYAFKNAFRAAFQQGDYSAHFITPIPLSKERLYERGFNQSAAFAHLLDKPVHSLLERPHLEKQSKKSRDQRIHSKNVFSLKEAIDIEGKQILLIDDIYTTGTTIRQAAAVLLEANAAAVSALTLIRS